MNRLALILLSLVVGCQPAAAPQAATKARPAALAAPATAGIISAPATQPNRAAVALGVNVDGIRDYSPTIFRWAIWSEWKKPDGTPINVDDHGYPTAGPAKSVSNLTDCPDGPGYTLTFEGAAFISFDGSLSIVPGSNRTVGNVTTAQVVKNGGGVGMIVDKLDPAHPLRNLKLFLPGEDPKNPATFRKAFLDLFPAFTGPIRLMNWGETNNNQIVHWSDRPLPEHWQGWHFATKRGLPIEWMIEFLAATGKNGWYCSPWLADDDYETKSAAMFAAGLPAGQSLELEKGNEWWNASLGGGWEFIDNYHKADADPQYQGKFDTQNGVTTFDPAHGADGNTKAARRGAEVARHTAEIWFKVFNRTPGQSSKRLRSVLGTNTAFPGWQTAQTQWLGLRWGGASRWFDSVCTTGYFSYHHDDTPPRGPAWPSDVPTILASIGKFMEGAKDAAGSDYGLQFFTRFAVANAAANGLEVDWYEGGEYVVANNSTGRNDPRVLVQYTPEMGALTSKLIDHAGEWGVKNFCYFSQLERQDNPNGGWGYLDGSIFKPVPSKYGAIMSHLPAQTPVVVPPVVVVPPPTTQPDKPSVQVGTFTDNGVTYTVTRASTQPSH